MPKKEILSFAECLAKLDRVRKDLTPEMIDVATQTDITMAEIKQMEQDGGDLKEAIKNFVPLTIYKKETELRLKDLNNTLKTYEQTHIYLKTQAKKDKGLVDELEEEVKKGKLTEEQLIVKIRELEKKLVKPLMVTVATETDLKMSDIAEMEANKKNIINFLDKSNLIKDEDKKRTILFKLDVIERGIAHLEEDREHNIENGRAMAEQMGKLEEDVRMGRIIENDLESRVKSLEGLLKRKESQYQKDIKVSEKKWKELDDKLKEISQLYQKNNETLFQANKDKEQLTTQITEKNNDLEKVKKELEQKTTDLKDGIEKNKQFLKELQDLKSKTLSDYEKEIGEKLNNISVNTSAFLDIFANLSLTEPMKVDEAMSPIYSSNILSIRNDLDANWNESETPNIPISKREVISSYSIVVNIGNNYLTHFNSNKKLIKEKDILEKQVAEKNEQIREEQKIIEDLQRDTTTLKNRIKDREEHIRVEAEEKTRVETENKLLKATTEQYEFELEQLKNSLQKSFKDKAKIKDEVDRRGKIINEQVRGLDRLREVENTMGRYWKLLEVYRNSSALGIGGEKSKNIGDIRDFSFIDQHEEIIKMIYVNHYSSEEIVELSIPFRGSLRDDWKLIIDEQSFYNNTKFHFTIFNSTRIFKIFNKIGLHATIDSDYVRQRDRVVRSSKNFDDLTIPWNVWKDDFQVSIRELTEFGSGGQKVFLLEKIK